MTAPNWTPTTWGEVVTLRYGRALRDYREHSTESVPVYGTNGPVGFTDVAQSKGPGVIVGRKGAYRGVHYSPTDFWVIDTAYYIDPLRPLNMRWAYYALKQADINGLDSGSAIPSTSREAFGSLSVTLPSLAEQEAIAEVLSALDDKIAANTDLVKLLDEHMKSLLLAGEAPRKVQLSEVAVFLNRRRVPLSATERERRHGTVPYYGATGVFGYVDEALFDEPIVLVGEDGSVMNSDMSPVTQYVWGPAWVNNHAHVLQGYGVSSELLFQSLRAADVSTLVTGAVQPKINMANLRRLELIIPEASDLSRIESYISAETATKRSLVEETRSLAMTRDALLPPLMSGTLRVRDAEAAVSAAGV